MGPDGRPYRWDMLFDVVVVSAVHVERLFVVE